MWSPSASGTIILSALVAHTAWHWMIDRADRLGQYQFEWPVVDALFLASAMRWLMLVVVLAGLAWLVRPLVGATPQPPREEPRRAEL